jgi:hypothetical protein
MRQELLSTSAKATGSTDSMGNPILHDVGAWLKAEIKKAMKEVDLKYIDPSECVPVVGGENGVFPGGHSWLLSAVAWKAS